jgi:hypothetical protein
MELAKAQEVESKMRLKFDQWLPEEREILATKYEDEVDELRTSLGVDVVNRDAKIGELETLQRLDDEKHEAELSIWRVQDRKLHSGLQGLEEALHGVFPSPLLYFCSFTLPPLSLAAPVEAFPDSDKVAEAAVEEYRVK